MSVKSNPTQALLPNLIQSNPVMKLAFCITNERRGEGPEMKVHFPAIPITGAVRPARTRDTKDFKFPWLLFPFVTGCTVTMITLKGYLLVLGHVLNLLLFYHHSCP